jgi:hypothetical protein
MKPNQFCSAKTLIMSFPLGSTSLNHVLLQGDPEKIANMLLTTAEAKNLSVRTAELHSYELQIMLVSIKPFEIMSTFILEDNCIALFWFYRHVIHINIKRTS